MGSFFKDNWPYIVIPFVLALLIVGALIVFGEGDNGAVFVYDVF